MKEQVNIREWETPTCFFQNLIFEQFEFFMLDWNLSMFEMYITFYKLGSFQSSTPNSYP